MSLSSYIHEQLAAAHRRELLDAADHSRLIAQAREQRSERQRFPLPSRGPAPRRWTIVEPRLSEFSTAVPDASTPRPHQLNRQVSVTFRGHHVSLQNGPKESSRQTSKPR
jgi:hypothetical protein